MNIKSNANFEYKIRKFLYEKDLIKDIKKYNWNPTDFINKKYPYGVHLEITRENPYYCFEAYSEANAKEPNLEYWENIRKSWESAFKKGKTELKKLFGKNVPKLSVELFIVDHSKHIENKFGNGNFNEDNYEDDFDIGSNDDNY